MFSKRLSSPEVTALRQPKRVHPPIAFNFTGRENDSTGIYYYRARYYSPQMQRFLQEDPIGLAGGDQNLYAYAFENPVRFGDPLGNWSAEAHQYLLRQRFGGTIDPTVLGLIVGGSNAVDAAVLQTPRFAPLHAMTSDVYPTPLEARNAMCKFIRTNMNAFRFYVNANQLDLGYTI